MYAARCSAAGVESCAFENPTTGPTIARGVMFSGCASQRVSNNAVEGPLSAVADVEAPVTGATGPTVEFGQAGPPAVDANAAGSVLTTSLLALGLFRYPNNTARPDATGLPEGSLIWVDDPSPLTSNLQVVKLFASAKQWFAVNVLFD